MSGVEGYEILARLSVKLENEGYVTVVDLLRQAGIESRPAQYRFGWLSLEDFRVKRIRTGRYELIVPNFEPLHKNGRT